MSGPGRETTAHTLLGGRVALEQPAAGYRTAIDPVLLAAAVPAVGSDGRVLDIGCGVGAAALCYATREPAGHVTGLELQPDLAALARANAAANGLAERFTVAAGDLLRPPPAVPGNGFDQVMANPPYLSADRADPSPDPGRAVAGVEGEADLAAWIEFGLSRLKPRGGLTLVQRADRLHEILAALGAAAGDIRILPLWPKAGRPAKRVIVAARKGLKGGVTLLPGLVLHEPEGAYTAAAEAVLRGAGNIPLTN